MSCTFTKLVSSIAESYRGDVGNELGESTGHPPLLRGGCRSRGDIKEGNEGLDYRKR